MTICSKISCCTILKSLLLRLTIRKPSGDLHCKIIYFIVMNKSKLPFVDKTGKALAKLTRLVLMFLPNWQKFFSFVNCMYVTSDIYP